MRRSILIVTPGNSSITRAAGMSTSLSAPKTMSSASARGKEWWGSRAGETLSTTSPCPSKISRTDSAHMLSGTLTMRPLTGRGGKGQLASTGPFHGAGSCISPLSSRRALISSCRRPLTTSVQHRRPRCLSANCRAKRTSSGEPEPIRSRRKRAMEAPKAKAALSKGCCGDARPRIVKRTHS